MILFFLSSSVSAYISLSPSYSSPLFSSQHVPTSCDLRPDPATECSSCPLRLLHLPPVPLGRDHIGLQLRYTTHIRHFPISGCETCRLRSYFRAHLWVWCETDPCAVCKYTHPGALSAFLFWRALSPLLWGAAFVMNVSNGVYGARHDMYSLVNTIYALSFTQR